MEEEGLLDITNYVHLFSLRYVFEPRINAHQLEFGNEWNNHPLSSEQNMSPAQLWLWGHHSNSSSHEISKVSNMYNLLLTLNGELNNSKNHITFF